MNTEIILDSPKKKKWSKRTVQLTESKFCSYRRVHIQNPIINALQIHCYITPRRERDRGHAEYNAVECIHYTGITNMSNINKKKVWKHQISMLHVVVVKKKKKEKKRCDSLEGSDIYHSWMNRWMDRPCYRISTRYRTS